MWQRIAYRTPSTAYVMQDTFSWVPGKVAGKWNQKIKNFIFNFSVKYGFLKQDTQSVTSMNIYDVNSADILQIAHKQMEMLYREGRTPDQIILGYDNMQRLKMDSMGSMSFSMEYAARGPYGSERILGLLVRLVPYIDGCIVLPKEERNASHEQLVRHRDYPVWARADFGREYQGSWR